MQPSNMIRQTPIEALDYDGPAIMLRAMAVECLLKA
jgi:hypothetical protein